MEMNTRIHTVWKLFRLAYAKFSACKWFENDENMKHWFLASSFTFSEKW
jgi:hypothetical protein